VFSDFGEVNQIIVPFNRITGNPHGFALVQFRDLLSAKDAIKSLDGAEVIGTILNVSWAFQNEKQ
jgi:RNA recognition motif-containing protein